jgi:hypothetical protein
MQATLSYTMEKFIFWLKNMFWRFIILLEAINRQRLQKTDGFGDL